MVHIDCQTRRSPTGKFTLTNNRVVFIYEDKLNPKTKSVQSKNSKWKAEVVDLYF